MLSIASLLGLFALVGSVIVLVLGLHLFRTRNRHAQPTAAVTRPVQPDAPTVQARPLPVLLPEKLPPPQQHGQLPYARTATVLSAAEQDFFRAALRAIPQDTILFPQVRLAGLVHTTERQQQRRKYDFYRIQAKTVDFVLCDLSSTAPRLVIELDDSSHDRPDRQQRDAFVDDVLASVGLPILHVRWSHRYDTQALAQAIHERIGLPASGLPTPLPLQPSAVLAAMITTPAPRSAQLSPSPAPINHQPCSVPSALVTQQVSEATGRGMQVACGTCRAPVSSQAKFCTSCGARLS